MEQSTGVMLEPFTQFRWTDILDIALVAAFIWMAFSWLVHTRSRLALLGVVFLGGVYVAARQLDLQLTASILQGLSAITVLALVVIFQDDLRKLFEQIAVWGLRRRTEPLPGDVVDVLTESVEHHARSRTGALYVIPGRQSLDPHLEGGQELDAKLNVALLLSLFDSGTPGHDGAVIAHGSRLSRFGVHLPLSTNHAEVGPGGTRHAAALGLAERTDALCIVVSEERGTITVARDGHLHRVSSPDELQREIRNFLGRETDVAGRPKTRQGWFVRWAEGLAAVLLALVAWSVLVLGSSAVSVERLARVDIQGLPAGYRLESVEPPEVQVLVEGPRLLLPRESEVLNVAIPADADLIAMGRRTFQIFPSQVEVSPRLRVISVRPGKVVLSLERLEQPP